VDHTISLPYSSVAFFSNQQILLDEPLLNEHLDLVFGINNSLLLSLTLDGGELNTSTIFPKGTFPSFTRLDVVICNQSKFSAVWTNPLLSYPDGLNIRIKLPSTSRDAVSNIIKTLVTVIKDYYGIDISITNVFVKHQSTELLLTGNVVSYDIIFKLFTGIFSSYLHSPTFIIVKNLLRTSAVISGFGFSLFKRDGKIKLIRKVLVGLKDVVTKNDDVLSFSWRKTFGTIIVPLKAAINSYVTLSFPFLVKVFDIAPLPDNKGAKISGLFQWLLKCNTFILRKELSLNLSYTLIENLDIHYPRVIASKSYSSTLLNNNGTLQLRYLVHNSGTSPAINTTATFPIP